MVESNTLFIARLQWIPRIPEASDADVISCLGINEKPVAIKFSKNKNSISIQFSSAEEATVVSNRISQQFPNLRVLEGKTIVSLPAAESIPIPITHADTIPPGLSIVPNFITREKEGEILSFLDSCAWDTRIKRRVIHFGFQFLYSNLNVHQDSEIIKIPEILESLVPGAYNQLTVNEYPPGIGIASHCDTHSAFGGTIPVISLGADITMDFISHDYQQRVSVVIPRGSLMLMSGESRYGWRHAIAARKTDRQPVTGRVVSRGRRVSLTFRDCLIPNKNCQCKYASLCDSQGADTNRPRRMKQG
jgi:hypothetical protein